MPPRSPREPERFDPRRHSTVVVNVNEKVPVDSILTRSNEFPLRTLIVGPTVGSASKHRPGTAPSNGRKHPDPAAPRFLDKEGRWVQEQLPVTVLETQAQPLSATVTIDAKVSSSTVKASKGVVRPVSAVHSYADISPVITAEHVKDVQGAVDGATLLRSQSPTFRGASRDGGRYKNVNVQAVSVDTGISPRYVNTSTQTQLSKGGANRARSQSTSRSAQYKSPYSSGYGRATSTQRRPATSSVNKSWPTKTTSAHGYCLTNGQDLTVPHSVLDHTLKTGQLGEPLPKPSFITDMYGVTQAGNVNATKGPKNGYQASPYAPKGNGGGGGAGGGAVGNMSGVTVNVAHHSTHEDGGSVQAKSPYAVATSNPFWPQNATHLARTDIARIDELGRGVVAGSANSRLVGGRWRYVSRPVEGDVVYTDYYGPNGKVHADYYGRSYHINSEEFAKNRLVNDSAYIRARASMMGIQLLRDKPGLAMDAAIVHGPTDKLEDVNRVTIPSSRMHRITEYHNLSPAQRPSWVN